MTRLVRATIASTASLIYLARVRPRLRTWGATRTEADGVLPGDDHVRSRYRTTHAVTIRRPVGEVWPWVIQMGYGRAGWYSYDALERLVGAGDFTDGGSAQRIVPELQSLSLGDTVALSASGGATVVELDPPRTMVLRFRMDLFTAASATPRSRAVLDWTWAFALVPVAPRCCRLLVRVRADPRPGALALAWPLLELIHFVMERKMLLTVRQRVEAAAMPNGRQHDR